MSGSCQDKIETQCWGTQFNFTFLVLNYFRHVPGGYMLQHVTFD